MDDAVRNEVRQLQQLSQLQQQQSKKNKSKKNAPVPGFDAVVDGFYAAVGDSRESSSDDDGSDPEESSSNFSTSYSISSSSSLSSSQALPYLPPVTKRQELLRAMTEALGEENIEKAEELREEFAVLTALKADPTQAEGSYQKFLDQDEWYMAERRKAMGIKPPPSKK